MQGGESILRRKKLWLRAEVAVKATWLFVGSRASPIPTPAPVGVLLGQDSSPQPTCPHQPWDLRVLTQGGPDPEHDLFSPLSSIKEKLMTQADRFSEEEVSAGFLGCHSVPLRVIS